MYIEFCPVCKSKLFEGIRSSEFDGYNCSCPSCGIFEISGSAAATLSNGVQYKMLSKAIRKLTDQGEKVRVYTNNMGKIIEAAGLAKDVKKKAEEILLDLVHHNFEKLENYGLFLLHDNLAIKAEKMDDPIFQYMVLSCWIQFNHSIPTSPYLIVMPEGERHARSLLEV